MLPQCQHQKVNKLGGQMRKGGCFAFGGFIEIVGKRHKMAGGGLRNRTLDRKFLVQVGKEING